MADAARSPAWHKRRRHARFGWPAYAAIYTVTSPQSRHVTFNPGDRRRRCRQPRRRRHRSSPASIRAKSHNALYGKIIPLSALGLARIGTAGLIFGPYFRSGGRASFAVSFGFPANPEGERRVYEIALDGKVAWENAGGSPAGRTRAAGFTRRSVRLPVLQRHHDARRRPARGRDVRRRGGGLPPADDVVVHQSAGGAVRRQGAVRLVQDRRCHGRRDAGRRHQSRRGARAVRLFALA